MDTMTPEQLFFIVGLVIIAGLVRVALHFRREIASTLVNLFARAPRRDYVEQTEITIKSRVVPPDTNAVPATLGTSTVPAGTTPRDDIIKAVALLYPDKSGNELATFFGGKRADVLALVKAARGGSNEPGPSEPGVNPISGRRTSAQFDDLPPLTPPMKMRRQTIDEETGALIYVD